MTVWLHFVAVIGVLMAVGVGWSALVRFSREHGGDDIIDGLIEEKAARPCGPENAPWTNFDPALRDRTKSKRIAEEAAVERARRLVGQVILPHEVKEFKRREA